MRAPGCLHIIDCRRGEDEGVRDDTWDLLIVGGGTAGLVGAYAGAELGARVALIERHRTGGDCLWTGCVPSKALVSAANRVHAARAASSVADVGDVRVDFAAVMRHVRGAIDTIEPVDSPQALRAAGVRVVEGEARFTGPNMLDVDGHRHHFHQALIATGATPSVPPLPGLADAEPLTTETLWDMDTLPDHLVVLGGGPVGCELSQAFARLGSRVTLVEVRKRLLSREDPDAAEVVRQALVADGVDVRLGHQPVKVVADPRGPCGIRTFECFNSTFEGRHCGGKQA